MTFNQFFEQYLSEGHDPATAEDMAWKMLQAIPEATEPDSITPPPHASSQDSKVMATIKHTQGTVKFTVGKVFTTAYGERINAVLTLANGEEFKLWGSPSDSTLLSLKKGQVVQLADGGKGWKLMLPVEEKSTALATIATPPQMPAQLPQRWTQEDINQFMGLVSDYSAGLGHCLKVVNQYRVDGLVQDEESVRTLATTLFIAATRIMKK